MITTSTTCEVPGQPHRGLSTLYLSNPFTVCYGNITSYTIEEVADELRIHPRTVRSLVSSGELPGFSSSRDPVSRRQRVRILESDVLAFIDSRRMQNQSRDSPRPKLPPVGDWV